MAKDSSFDITSKTDMAEVDNAINQVVAEIRQRYDFKGSKSEVTVDHKENVVKILADDELKLKQVIDIVQSKLVKRQISLKALDYGKVESATGEMVRQPIAIQQGIPIEKAKEIVKIIKQAKLKVQASIQEDQVRVSGKKKDDLQEVMNLIKEKDLGIDTQFTNYR